MIKTAITFILIAISSTAYGNENRLRNVEFINPEVIFTTNIHNNKNYCSECHEGKPARGSDRALRYNNYTLTCRCHGYTPENYNHPVGIKLSVAAKGNIPAKFPLEKGVITCNTCHAIAMQCEDGLGTPGQSRNFLRIDSRQSRTTICFSCHNKTKYARMNPHKQLNEQGDIIESKCRYCHIVKPDEKTDSLKKQRALASGNVEFVADFFTLCFRCHFGKTIQHVLGNSSFLTKNANHLKRPPPRILADMQAAEERLGVIFPLDDAGSLTCATCHNPHERGVIPHEKDSAKGASEKYRLRVTKNGSQICQACHNK
jgi:hypothetical protein